MSYKQNRGTVFIFAASNGTQDRSSNIYTSWTDLIADIAGIEGEKTIQFDLSVGGSLVIPSGAYDLRDITLSGGPNATQVVVKQFGLAPGSSGNDGVIQANLSDGVTFTNFTHITNGLELRSKSDSSIVTLSGNGITNLVIDNGAAIGVERQSAVGGGGGPGFFSVTSTAVLNIYLHNGGLLDLSPETSNGLIVDVQDSGATCNIFASGQSRIEANLFTDSGATGAIEATDVDGAPTIFTDNSGSTGDPGLVGGFLVVTNNVDADSIAYDNVTSGLTGENVQDAIDDLAARGVAEGVTTVSITSALGADDGPLIDVTAGSITITLPAVASAAVGKTYHIKDTDGLAAATNITIEGDGAETIDGELNFVLTTNFQGLTVVNLGDKWTVI